MHAHQHHLQSFHNRRAGPTPTTSANMNMSSQSATESPRMPHSTNGGVKQKRGSWALLADMAADMVNSLELSDNDLDYNNNNNAQQPSSSQPSYQYQPASKSKSHAPPTMDIMKMKLKPAATNSRKLSHSSTTPARNTTGRRGSGTLLNLFSGDEEKQETNTNMLPSINSNTNMMMSHHQSANHTQANRGVRRRGSETIMNLFNNDDHLEDDYDPSSVCLKAQAKQSTQQQRRRSRGMDFTSINASAKNLKASMVLKKGGIGIGGQSSGVKKDPLMDFHEKHNRAQNEFLKQEDARKRREQVRDYDDEKSMSSSNSFFDFLTKTGAADELMMEDNNMLYSRDAGGSRNNSVRGETTGGGTRNNTSANTATGTGEGGGSKMKRSGSVNTMASFFSLFGDDDEEIAKLSSATTPNGQRTNNRQSGSSNSNNNGSVKTKNEEEPTLQAAVNQSKSVKGYRVYKRGLEAARKRDFKKAIAYYHIALVKQREYYGDDHVQTSNTLNSLGLALMELGEHFGALTALEEALHIRQELLGAGAEEVAETTSNIWMVLKASQGEEDS